MNLVAMDDALLALAEIDSRIWKLVELKYFGGLTNPEAAEVLGVSQRTVERELTRARGMSERADALRSPADPKSTSRVLP